MAVEIGCWLGATTLPLLRGLIAAGYDRPYHAFDRWRASADEVAKARHQGLSLREGEDLLPIYRSNVLPAYSEVLAHQGDLDCTFNFPEDTPVEVCVLDAPKKDPLFSHIMDEMMKVWIPKVTIVGLLDYHFYRRRPGELEYFAPVNYLDKQVGRFEKLWDRTEQTSAAFFRYLG